MACSEPMQALRTDALTKSGKAVVKFLKRSVAYLYKDDPRLLVGLPCGQCTECRLERSRVWAVRCMNEAQLHDENCFVTLTFDEPSLLKRDTPLSLDRREFVKFMKRLRKRRIKDYFNSKLLKFLPRFARKFLMRYASKKVPKVRYYMCGEYGDFLKRPHYHAILFGIDFPDKVLEKIENGKRYYSSAYLRSLWPFGNNIITDVSFDTCAYVARYIMKKVLGKNAWLTYSHHLDEVSGELVRHRIAEYTTMSRRPGIGKTWFDKYFADVYPKDKIFMRNRGYVGKPPKYYDSHFEIMSPSEFASLKAARIKAALSKSDDNTPERLQVKHIVKLAQIKSLKRDLE